jgi:CRP/FNR family transcriptional regulator, nitrogen oxide reductase regulator
MAVHPELSLLEQVQLFKGLDSNAYQELLHAAQSRIYPRDSFLFYQDDPVERVYVVITGRVKLFQLTPEGQQVIMRVGTPGMMIAAISIVEGAVYPVTAQTAEDCKLLSWTQEHLLQFINRYPPLALNALRLLAEHVREFQDRYRELATERVERRLARTIIRLASQAGKKTSEGVLLDLPLSRQDLAEMSGTTLFTVSRILSQWELKGLIHAGREKVVIIFPHGLVRIADDLPSGPAKNEE